MRASIRRIDLTTNPATVDVWPSIDWLTQESDVEPATQDEHFAGPRGRGGLWAAMANAVARARESSMPPAADPQQQAEVIDLVLDAPHLAYLASVSAGGEDEEAEVIAFDPRRTRDAD
jgi:hypothetical protein